MKINPLIVVITAIFFTACTPGVPAQEVKSNNVPTATFAAEATTPGFTVTLEPTATKLPTITPTQTAMSCVTLLSPANEIEIPAIGKITFAWEAMRNATFYVLNITLPSGVIVSWETDQTSRDQYMEAFPAGGEYQWNVVVQDRKKSEICSSEVATFSKAVYYAPRPTEDNRKRK